MWMHFLKTKSNDNIKIALVGNKSDKEDNRKVQTVEGVEKSNTFGSLFMEVSAKTGDRLFELFRTIT